MSQQQQIKWFRLISLAEGISFLILLLIAMPLKYMADWPLGVKVVGMAHGFLFIAYLIALILVSQFKLWKLKLSILFALAAFLPLAPFWVERRLKEWS